MMGRRKAIKETIKILEQIWWVFNYLSLHLTYFQAYQFDHCWSFHTKLEAFVDFRFQLF